MTIADVSGNGNVGTLTTAASWTTGGRFGNGLLLVDDAQGVSVAASPSLNVVSGLTVEAWIRPTSTAGYPKLLWREGEGGSPFNLAMAFGNGTLVFAVLTTAGNYSVFAYSSLVPGVWTHVAATYDGAMLRIYIDGVLVSSAPASGTIVPGTRDLWLGRAPWGEGFAGGYDEVRVYGRALTVDEIARDRDTQVSGLDPPDVGYRSPAPDALGVAPSTVVRVAFSKPINAVTLTNASFYLTGPSGNVPAGIAYDAAPRVATLTPTMPLARLTKYAVHITTDVGDADEGTLRSPVTWTFTTGPDEAVAHAAYAFSEGTGSTAADSSANGNTAALTRAGLWTAAGRYGGGLLLAGGTDGARVPASPSLEPGPGLTVETWVYPTSVAGYPKLIWRDGLNGSPFNLGMAWGDGTVVFGVTTTSGSFGLFAYRSIIPDRWTHVAATYDGSTLGIYVNGQLMNTAATEGSIIQSARDLWLGRAPWGEGLAGTLDEVRVYNRALSGAEISLDMSTSIDDVTPPVVMSVSPGPGATSVSPIGSVTASFSESLASSTVTASTLVLANASNGAVAATVSYDDGTHTATLTPSAALAEATTYTAKVKGGSNGVTDTAGNPFVTDYAWSFTTADLTAPRVTTVVPSNGATGVGPTATLMAVFSEPLASTTVTTSTFTLTDAANAVIAASASYNGATHAATVTPHAALTGGTTYTLTVKGGSAGIQDVAGNPLAADYSWSFTTAEAPPLVTGVTPAAGATDVNASTEVLATFSKDLASASVNTSTFELRDEAGLSIQASVSYDSATRTATLHPSSPLGSATYTAIVKGGWSGVKDPAGHSLAGDYAWSFTSANSSAPTITATFSPPPNAAGWNTGNVTATFTCADADGVATCTPPLQVTGEGARIPVTGTARDTMGNSTTKTWYVNIDKTGPVVHVYYPANGSNLPTGTASVVIRGGAFDVSGVDFVTCAGVPATLTGGLFACAVDVAGGSNTVTIQAADRTGRMTSLSVTFAVGDPTVTSLDISPGSTVMFAGDSREIYAKDQNGNEVHQGTWAVSDSSIAAVVEADGVTTLTALAAGTATVSVTYSGHTARATVKVYPAGTELPGGTTLWSLNDDSGLGAPKRGKVLRAASTGGGDGDPTRAPALFFVDEGTEWSADSLIRFFDRPTRIRTTSADGRQLSEVSFGGRVPQQIAADYNDGVIVVLPSVGTLPSTIQRFDGRTGQVSWEYVAVGGFLTDVAIHPDGTIYASEFHITGTSFLVSIAPSGAVVRRSLPQGRFQQVDAGTCGFDQGVKTPAHVSHPIIREDGTVVVLTHQSDAMRFVTSSADESGRCTSRTISQSATASAFAIEFAGASSIALRPIDISSWDIPDQTLEQQQLLPDGHDGLLVVDRKRPSVIRVDADYRVVVKNNQLVPNDATRYYETEYVLGDDAAYAVMNSYVFFSGSGNRYRTRVMSFDPETLQTVNVPTDLGTPMTAPQHIRMKFALSGGGVYAVGPTTAYVVNTTVDTTGFAMGGNASPVAGGVWGGWSGTGTPEAASGAEAVIAQNRWAYAGGLESANAPSPRLLTTTGLRDLARSEGVSGDDVEFNRSVGIAFQNFSLWSFGLDQNNDPLTSEARKAATGGTGITIPDAVATHLLLSVPIPIPIPRSAFFEVKAVARTLTLSYSNQQILGLIDLARQSPLGKSFGGAVRPTLTFITTANTFVGSDAIALATATRVELRQSLVAELAGGWLQVLPTVTLNPRAPAWSHSVPKGPGRIGRLLGHPGAPPFGDPDPTILVP